MKMIPDETDKKILEYCTNGEAWHILCGEYCDEFDDPTELIRRIFALPAADLLQIKGETPATSAAFQNDARQRDWHRDDVVTDGPWWDITTTKSGFEFVKDRFVKK